MKKKKWINNISNYKNYKTFDKRIRFWKLRDKRSAESRFNLDKFDVEDMKFRIRKLPRIYKDRYEHDLRPTMHQILLVRRKYKVFRKTTIDKTSKC